MYWIVQQAVKPPVNSPGVRAATAKEKGPKQIPVDRPFLKGPLWELYLSYLARWQKSKPGKTLVTKNSWQIWQSWTFIPFSKWYFNVFHRLLIHPQPQIRKFGDPTKSSFSKVDMPLNSFPTASAFDLKLCLKLGPNALWQSNVAMEHHHILTGKPLRQTRQIIYKHAIFPSHVRLPESRAQKVKTSVPSVQLCKEHAVGVAFEFMPCTNTTLMCLKRLLNQSP